MGTIIFCVTTAKGNHTFHLSTNGQRYYLYNQDYRKGAQEYFNKGVSMSKAMNCSRSHNDSAVKKQCQRFQSI